MKIMLFNTLFSPNIIGGAEKSVQLLAQGLIDLGHEVIAVSISNHAELTITEGIKAYYIHHHNIYWGGMPGESGKMKKIGWHVLDILNPGIYRDLKKILNMEKPDIIHTNMLTGFSAVPWILAKHSHIPVVHTLREYNLICEKSTMFDKGRNCAGQCFTCKVFTALKKYLTNHGYVDHVVGLSDFILRRHQMQGYFCNTPGSRIFNGINGIEKAAASNRGTNTVPPLKLLYLGRIDKAKGIVNLLDTVENLGDIKLYLGGRVLNNKIQAKIDAGLYPDNIKFLGFIDPDEFLDAVDAVIVPSVWHEPFGRVVIEAYQHGKPVIASNRGGLSEIVLHGETGFLYNPDNNDELTDILMQLMHASVLQNMAVKIPIYFKQFENQHIARQYEKIYQAVTS